MSDVKKDIYSIKITNVLGQEVFVNTQLISGIYQETIDLTSYEKGVYLIEISNTNSSITNKIIVE
jgi:hypothetical protein